MTRATFAPLPLGGELELDPPPPLPDDRADELRLRDEAADEPRLDALALARLLREPAALLLDDPLLDPFALREVVCRLLEERELLWAMAPP